MAKSVLQQAGFAGELLDTMLGIEWVECLDPMEGVCLCHPELPPRRNLHYYDAIGDTDKVDDKWRPAAGAGQVRGLWHPEDYGPGDNMRKLPELLDPIYNAQTCFALHKRYGFNLWSPFKSGTYLSHKGEDFELHSGHKRAHLWDITEPVPL